MSRACVASPLSGWANLQPFHHANPPGPMLTAATLLGGLTLAGVPSVKRYIPVSMPRSPTALARMSPMGFLVIEAGASYIEWLNTISKPFNDPVYTNINTTNNNYTSYHLPSDSPSPLFTHSKDIIPLPPKALSNPSPITKDLVFVGHSPTCSWARGGEPVDSDDQPERRRSARIAAASLVARDSATRTSSAPNVGSRRGRAPHVTNGGRRGGRSGGGGAGPGGGGARNGASSGRRGGKRGAGGAPAPGPPSPPSTQLDNDDPNNDDSEGVGWVYLLFFTVLLLFVGMGSVPKAKPPPRVDEYEADLVVARLKSHPFTRITRMDMTSFFLFFILCGPGSEKRRSNMAYFLGVQESTTTTTTNNNNNYVLQPESLSVSIQHNDQPVTATLDSNAHTVETVPAAIEDHDDHDSFSSEYAFYADSEASGSNIEVDLSLALTATCNSAVKEESVDPVVVDGAVTRWKGKGKAVGGIDGAVLDSASFEDAVSPATISTFSRLYVPIYKHRRSYPKTITVFVQADNPTQGFVHFHLPNNRSNNRVMAVDLSRRKIPFLAKRIAAAGDEVVVEGEGEV